MTPLLKAGMVGLDTSHCLAFLSLLHDPASPYYVPGVRVTGVYPGGSEQFSLSRERVKNISADIDSRFQIPVYQSIPELARDVDVLFLTSVDGRQHPEEFSQMAVGKPVFIDKPFAVSSTDAAAILQRAASTATPVMSCSALRYAQGIAEPAISQDGILACEAYGPAPILPDYPGYFWYGIHSAEILFRWMGPGCESVRTLTTASMDVLSGVWNDGRSGLVLGSRFAGSEFGCLLHQKSGAHLRIARDTPPYYFGLLNQIVPFFQSGQSPLDSRETYQIIAFLEAANQSKAENGQLVPVSPLPTWI